MNSRTVQVLLALVIGIALGVLISATGNPTLARVVGWIEPIGTLWINAIRMIVIPLVFGAIIVGVAETPELATVGRVGGKAVLGFVCVLTAGAVFAVVVAPFALAYLHIDPAAAAALRAGAGSASASAVQTAQKIDSPLQWLVQLIPTNPIKAAADGALLPLIVFAIAFALALTQIQAASRETFLNFARALRDASLTLVGWILVAAPLGVFALSLGVALKLGTAAAGAVAFYIALVCGTLGAFVALLYVLTFLFGRVRSFTPWAAAQAVGFSSRASMVALPNMIAAAETMRQPLVIRSFFLPLAVAMFRAGSAVNIPLGVLFVAHLYSVDVGTAQLVTIVLMSVITTLTIPSIPSGTIIVMVPVMLAANLPVEGVGILIAIDTLPDMFRTLTHVTGDLTLAALLGRSEQVRAGKTEAAVPAPALHG